MGLLLYGTIGLGIATLGGGGYITYDYYRCSGAKEKYDTCKKDLADDKLKDTEKKDAEEFIAGYEKVWGKPLMALVDAEEESAKERLEAVVASLNQYNIATLDKVAKAGAMKTAETLQRDTAEAEVLLASMNALIRKKAKANAAGKPDKKGRK